MQHSGTALAAVNLPFEVLLKEIEKIEIDILCLLSLQFWDKNEGVHVCKCGVDMSMNVINETIPTCDNAVRSLVYKLYANEFTGIGDDIDARGIRPQDCGVP